MLRGVAKMQKSCARYAAATIDGENFTIPGYTFVNARQFLNHLDTGQPLKKAEDPAKHKPPRNTMSDEGASIVLAYVMTKTQVRPRKKEKDIARCDYEGRPRPSADTDDDDDDDVDRDEEDVVAGQTMPAANRPAYYAKDFGPEYPNFAEKN